MLRAKVLLLVSTAVTVSAIGADDFFDSSVGDDSPPSPWQGTWEDKCPTGDWCLQDHKLTHCSPHETPA